MSQHKRLTRSGNRMLAGVCGGIAEYFGWDPTWVRIGYVLLTFFTLFSGGFVYILLWIIMPENRR
ncbi:MAG: PspC domain-containing protein [Bacteroides sp.]|nr:PspC domain-containing protein [Bacteroides sp.]